MPINPIHPVQRQQKPDISDKIFRGLEIAASIFKIPEAIEASKRYSQDTDRLAAETDLRKEELATKRRFAQGIYTPAELASAKLMPAAPGDKNTFDAYLLLPGGQKQATKLKPSADLAQLENMLDIKLKSAELGLLPTKKAKADIELSSAKEALNTPKPEQALSAGFAARMIRSHQALEDLEKAGFEPASIRTGIENFRLTPNIFRRGTTQQYNQAKLDFVTANLRKESGAAIPPKELQQEFIKYFPQTGDSPEAIEQKNLARAQAIENMKLAAGEKALSKLERLPLARVKKEGGGIINEAVAGEMSAEDKAALQWARSNPKDKRASKILQRLGVK